MAKTLRNLVGVTAAMVMLVPGSVEAADASVCALSHNIDGDLSAEAARFFPDAGETEIAALIHCMAAPDPKIRDDYAFALWSQGLRDKQISPANLEFAGDKLLAILKGDDDVAGFRRPFAALALSEVVRADRAAPIWSARQLHAVAEVAATYMRGISDYRGFVDGEGWRHGVAHTADLMLQLALNPRLTRADASGLLAALAVQVAPQASPFYHHGEAGRLARPVLFLARRTDMSEADWSAWFATLYPDGSARWQLPYASTAGLSAVHNSTAFAQALYIGASQSKDPQIQRLAVQAANLLRAIP